MASDTGTGTGSRRPPDGDPPDPATSSTATRSWWRRWRTGWLFPARRPRAPEPEPPPDAPSSLLRRRRRDRRFSPLTRRILLMNMLPIAFLAAGVVFLGDYEDALIEAELAALTVHGEIVATGLGEGAVRGSETTINRVEREQANQLMLRLTNPIGIRGRLFAETGEMLGDTRVLRDRSRITSTALPPPDAEPPARTWFTRANDWIDARLRVARSDGEYVDLPDPVARDYPWVEQALRGVNTRTVRRTAEGRLVLSAAVPIQRYKQVLGALMLTHDDRAIAARVRQVRLDMFRLSAIALAATILLSLFLASTIARPIQRLARAADQIGHARDGAPRMPDVGARNDEIGELADALRAMTDALWRRMDAIESFAADVAHELKNPLTSLRSAVEVAARIDDPEKRGRLMAIVLDDVHRLNRLISDISDSSRLDAELMRGEIHAVDIGGLLTSMTEGYNATSAAKAGVRVALDLLGGGPFTAIGHDGRYGQVFRNVVDNALSFSPAGATITIGAMRERERIVVTIDDQGPGIPDANLESIFKRFYSERPSAEQFGKHSGLGLSICRQIVDAYGGSIAAGNRRDADGRVLGARFTITLPAA